MVVLNQVYWLVQRQFFLVRNSLIDFCINYVLLWPCIFSLSSGYFIPLVFFPHDPIIKGTEMVVGMLLLQSFVVGYFMMVDLVNERGQSGIFHYHVMATSFAAAFTARIVFYVLYVYCALVPFVPMAKVLLQGNLYTDQLSWVLLMGLLFFVATLVVTYIFALSAMVRELRSIEHSWSYGVEPILWLSGMMAPSYALAKSGLPGISWVLFINPFAYASDALRQLFFHDSRFASIHLGMSVMIVAIVLFVCVAYRLLKKQIRAV